MKKFKFKCPHCGSNRVQEEQSSAVVLYNLNEISIDENGDGTMEYEQDSVGGDDISIRFICAECGKAIEGVNSEEAFYEWIKNHGEEER